MKVLTALSGGVDSSVAASLLLKEGHTVGGATLHLVGTPSPDARQAAEALSIPFYEFFEEEAFTRLVIQNFSDSYARGETPNPCIVCNRLIKFGLLLDHAKALGYDKIATGHYAKVGYHKESGRYMLYRGKDRTKDQSYMLYQLTQDQLAHSLFPLGDLTKREIRELAQTLNLPAANKPDSQDICFVPDGDYAAFLENFTKTTPIPGDFVDEEGTFLGTHKGIIRYTVGQRKGLGIALGKPAFVLSKNAEKNQVVLSTDSTKLHTDRVYAEDVNWMITPPKEAITATAKTRYSQKEETAIIHPLGDGKVLAEFHSPQRAPAPGQAMVFYDGEMVLGGGRIIKGDI